MMRPLGKSNLAEEAAPKLSPFISKSNKQHYQTEEEGQPNRHQDTAEEEESQTSFARLRTFRAWLFIQHINYSRAMQNPWRSLRLSDGISMIDMAIWNHGTWAIGHRH